MCHGVGLRQCLAPAEGGGGSVPRVTLEVRFLVHHGQIGAVAFSGLRGGGALPRFGCIQQGLAETD